MSLALPALFCTSNDAPLLGHGQCCCTQRRAVFGAHRGVQCSVCTEACSVWCTQRRAVMVYTGVQSCIACHTKLKLISQVIDNY